MRFLLISFSSLFAGCTSAYQSLVPIAWDANCVKKFKPVFKAELYKSRVDVMNKQISGLLFFKTGPDSSLRVVFMNEAGITFFDFEFLSDSNFKTHHVIHSLDKKPVIQTLRQDIELIMMRKAGKEKPISYSRGSEVFNAFPSMNETDYIVTNKDCTSLLRLEKGTRRKKKTEVLLFNSGHPAPDSIYIRHLNFNMTISLKKLARE